MNFNDRFASNDPEEKGLKCFTCGATCEDAGLHHEWHNEQERWQDYFQKEIQDLHRFTQGEDNGQFKNIDSKDTRP